MEFVNVQSPHENAGKNERVNAPKFDECWIRIFLGPSNFLKRWGAEYIPPNLTRERILP